MSDPRIDAARGIHLEESVTVNRTPWELYEFWRNLENLPRFMNHLHTVRKLDERALSWGHEKTLSTSMQRVGQATQTFTLEIAP